MRVPIESMRRRVPTEIVDDEWKETSVVLVFMRETVLEIWS
jgi:hypothetical protein